MDGNRCPEHVCGAEGGVYRGLLGPIAGIRPLLLTRFTEEALLAILAKPEREWSPEERVAVATADAHGVERVSRPRGYVSNPT
jgi:hypothetical protein